MVREKAEFLRAGVSLCGQGSFEWLPGALFKGIMPESEVRYKEEGDTLASPGGPTTDVLVSVTLSLKTFRQEIRKQEMKLSSSIPGLQQGHSEFHCAGVPDPPDQFLSTAPINIT